MKTKRILLLFALITAGGVWTGRSAADPSTLVFDTAVDRYDRSHTSQPMDDSRFKKQMISIGNGYQLSSPLAAPSVSDKAAKTSGDRRTQAWVSIVGWHPGSSAFPDPIAHEAGLTLITVSRKPR